LGAFVTRAKVDAMIKICLRALVGLLVVLYGQAVRATDVTITATTFPGTITDDQWKVFARAIETDAEPKVALKMLIRGELGSEEVMVNAVRRGRAQITAQSLTGTSQMIPELAVLALPFLFESTAQMDWVYDMVVPVALEPMFAERGLALLDFIDSGWVGVYARDPLVEPQQLTGYKLRTPTVLAAQMMAQALKADAIYIPFPDILPALQTGLIKGGITSDYAFYTGGINAEAPYFIYTKHTYDMGFLIAHKPWFEALSPTNQRVFRAAWGGSQNFRARYRAHLAEEMTKLSAKGTKVIELTATQRARWVSATQISHGQVLERLGPSAVSFYDKVQAGKRAFDAARPRE
jgi:TRAP-type transport system periplasmic protein